MLSRRVRLLSIVGVIGLSWGLWLAVSPNSAADKSKKTDSASKKSKADAQDKKDAAADKPESAAEDDTAPKKVVKTDAEWRKILNPLQFRVTRKKGTEIAGTGKYAHTKTDGIYRCICCGQPLFDSKTKFESGTGWPSFFQALNDKAVNYIEDNSAGEVRTEVECSRCDAHLGHVFSDGPQPTGLRYCMNSAALNLVSRKSLEKDPKAKDAKSKSPGEDKENKAKSASEKNDESPQKSTTGKSEK
ncbi:MAG: peptide-methionine (R)-S-oxide reductase MsrB [Planctomycetia bacterium]|nr:peptide-methionine (R)-S-oxide reductase MsrB [Planctomycetia bacterium]